MPNRLAHETSPYLLQHQHNPVDWHPWGPEAIERAKREQKPIFLSIGYSACHWCHVMEHESFEDSELAATLNRDFVCIKVDREERPDLDQVYMNAVQLMTGRGGWPMSVFLTPELEPFFGGTYWPPRAGRGMPGFDQVLQGVANAWQHRRLEAVTQAGELARHLRDIAAPEKIASELSEELLFRAEATLARQFDRQHGGFGTAPKFPHSMDLQVLLRTWRRTPRDGSRAMVQQSLDGMAGGGIYDHLGGGFCRYSVDERWLVPHFEKMLYDNALLASAYLDAYLAWGDDDHARVVRETLDYVLRDMTDPLGGFYSTEDADSEGEEGKFYVWTPAEIHAVLGPDAARTFCEVYDVSPAGNFDGHNILNLPQSLDDCARQRSRDPEELRRELASHRAKLFAVRAKRVRPARDDKVLVAWNGLMIDILARAAPALAEPKYLVAAQAAAKFLLLHVRRADGRLLHTWRNGHAKLAAYLDDYAALANSLVSLYEATFDESWLDEAARLVDVMLTHFADEEHGGFYFTAHDHEQLIARTKDVHDNATPSGNALAATVLIRLARLTGLPKYIQAAERTLAYGGDTMQRFPTAAGQMLLALDMHLGPTVEIVLVGEPDDPEMMAVTAVIHRSFLPLRVLAARRNPAAGSPLLAEMFRGKSGSPTGVTMYLCQHFACQTPAVGLTECLAAIERLIGAT